jgi:hypothetical protein
LGTESARKSEDSTAWETPTVRGSPQIQAFVSQVLTPLDASQHLVTNHQIEARTRGLEVLWTEGNAAVVGRAPRDP